MPDRKKTLAEHLAWAGATSPQVVGGDLSQVREFGADPGALKMWLHIPDSLAPASPLVVVLHGCGQTAAGYAAGAGWLELAERYGFALLCPEQTRPNNANLCFNWFETADIGRGAGEAASIAQMVVHALAHHDLDPGRVFVTGLSAGGAMAAAMLAAYPEVFAAGAIVAGLPYGAASGVHQALGAMRRVPELSGKAWGDKVRSAAPATSIWPSISIWHGAADTTVTPAAGDALALQWADVHGSVGPVREKTASARHDHRTWRGADGRVVVETHRIAGLGHGAPISATGVDGCGSPGPWILEAGVSSSLEIARSWGIASARRAAAARPSAQKPSTRPEGETGRRQILPPTRDVGETIARALRGAGLLR